MYFKPVLTASALALALSLNAMSAHARDLVMGLIPAENNEEMIQKFESMRVHLEKKLGQKVKVFTATEPCSASAPTGACGWRASWRYA